MLNLLTNHPILFRTMIYGIPLFTFALGMFAMYKVKVRKALNYKQICSMMQHNREELNTFYTKPLGVQTNELSEKLKRNFGESPYDVWFVDAYGFAHVVTHAQVEMKGMTSGLVLYSLITSDYDNKGNYRG